LQDTIFFHQTVVPRSRPFCSISFNKGDRLVSLQLPSHANTCDCTLRLHLRHIPCCAFLFRVLSNIISPNHISHIISISDRAEIHGKFFFGFGAGSGDVKRLIDAVSPDVSRAFESVAQVSTSHSGPREGRCTGRRRTQSQLSMLSILTRIHILLPQFAPPPSILAKNLARRPGS